jgi:hypothetical protein
MNDEAARQGRPANSAEYDGSSARGRLAPAVVITFPFEGAPTVAAVWDTDSDDRRMVEWLDAHPEYERLIFEAVDLSGEAA